MFCAPASAAAPRSLLATVDYVERVAGLAALTSSTLEAAAPASAVVIPVWFCARLRLLDIPVGRRKEADAVREAGEEHKPRAFGEAPQDLRQIRGTQRRL